MLTLIQKLNMIPDAIAPPEMVRLLIMLYLSDSIALCLLINIVIVGFEAGKLRWYSAGGMHAFESQCCIDDVSRRYE